MKKMNVMSHVPAIAAMVMAGGLMFTACNKEEEKIEPATPAVASGFHLNVENSGKTIVDRASVEWEVGDRLKINGTESEITNASTGEVDYSPVATDPITVVYPASAISSSFTGATSPLTGVVVKNSLSYKTNGNKQSLELPMIGHAVAGATSVTMYHLCAAIDLNISNQFTKDYTVTSIQLTHSSQNIAGTLTVTNPTAVYTGGENVPTCNVTSGQKTIIMNTNGALVINGGDSKRVQIPILPITSGDGTLTVTVNGKMPDMPGAVVATNITVNYSKGFTAGVERAKVQGINVLVGPTGGNLSGNGMFSVDANKKVAFSKGNLQYKANGNQWRFAEHQFDTLGRSTSNGNVTSPESARATQTKWIDLFGFGTSGWNGSGATAYQPYAISTDNSHYIINGNSNQGLTGDFANADWGVYNTISAAEGNWRVLTDSEWNYLLYQRSTNCTVNNTPNARYTKAIMYNGICGLIIFPDGFTGASTSGVNWKNINTANITDWTSANVTEVTTSQAWTALQNAGCVFLPAAGYRSGSTVNFVGAYGGYWSSSANDASYARGMSFYAGDVNPQTNGNRRYGFSVRLVQEY